MLVSMIGATWLTGAWTAFWILRRSNLHFGLAPMAAVLAINVINDPGQPEEPFRVAIWMALAAALALRLNLAGLRSRWPRFDDEVGWSVRLRGARSLVLLLAVAFLLPPLQSSDLSGRVFSTTGRTDTAGATGDPLRRASARSTGYVELVAPGATIHRSNEQVMVVSQDLSRSVYWRGIDLYRLRRGIWDAENPTTRVTSVPAGRQLSSGSFRNRQLVYGQIQVTTAGQYTVFWPGEPVSAGIDVVASGPTDSSGARLAAGAQAAYARVAIKPGQVYNVIATVSTATAEELRSAGVDYPADIQQLTSSLAAGSTVDRGVRSLTREVTAGKKNVYDEVTAIETYLRSHFTYRLDVVQPPAGQDPVSFFLLSSRTGYCEYFASSMGEMVRSLGIPVRLVNGYGPGEPVEEAGPGRTTGRAGNVIRASDAHTWVEVYFPSYGWIPFEPTPDPKYPVLPRGPVPADQTASAPAPASLQPALPQRTPRTQPAAQLLLLWLALWVLVLMLTGAVLVGALVVLGPAWPRDPAGPWRRLEWLGRRLGIVSRPAETPLEYSSRLARALPQLAFDISEIGRGYSCHRYSRSGLSQDALSEFNSSWGRVRRSLIGLMVRGAQQSSGPQPASRLQAAHGS